jgi:hypothetical protein
MFARSDPKVPICRVRCSTGWFDADRVASKPNACLSCPGRALTKKPERSASGSALKLKDKFIWLSSDAQSGDVRLEGAAMTLGSPLVRFGSLPLS